MSDSTVSPPKKKRMLSQEANASKPGEEARSSISFSFQKKKEAPRIVPPVSEETGGKDFVLLLADNVIKR